MKRSFLTSLVILFLILIFIIWSFNLKEALTKEDIKDSFLSIFKETVKEIKDSFKDLDKEAEILKNRDPIKPLTDKEINRLKEKILKYEEEY